MKLMYLKNIKHSRHIILPYVLLRSTVIYMTKQIGMKQIKLEVFHQQE